MAKSGSIRVIFGTKVAMEWMPDGTAKVVLTQMSRPENRPEWSATGTVAEYESDDMSNVELEWMDDERVSMTISGVDDGFSNWLMATASLMTSEESGRPVVYPIRKVVEE